MDEDIPFHVTLAKPREKIEATGERCTPWITEPTLSEHMHRYISVLEFIKGKRVLDIACGEGYGSALMALAGAASVTGVDIDVPTVTRAKRIYRNINGLTFLDSDIRNPLPFQDHEFDAIICFETIEHIHEQSPFVKELCRVMDPAGFLVMSTPDKNVSETRGVENEFHEKELYIDEFKDLLAEQFPCLDTYYQRFFCGSGIFAETPSEDEKPPVYWDRSGFIEYSGAHMPLSVKYAIILASHEKYAPMATGLLHDGHILSSLRKKMREAQAGAESA